MSISFYKTAFIFSVRLQKEGSIGSRFFVQRHGLVLRYIMPKVFLTGLLHEWAASGATIGFVSLYFRLHLFCYRNLTVPELEYTRKEWRHHAISDGCGCYIYLISTRLAKLERHS